MGMLNEFESKLDLANKKLDLLIAKIDALLGTVPLADPIDMNPNLGGWEQVRVDVTNAIGSVENTISTNAVTNG
jgi:hypothetical protein